MAVVSRVPRLLGAALVLASVSSSGLAQVYVPGNRPGFRPGFQFLSGLKTIVTEAGSPLATEAGSYLVRE